MPSVLRTKLTFAIIDLKITKEEYCWYIIKTDFISNAKFKPPKYAFKTSKGFEQRYVNNIDVSISRCLKIYVVRVNVKIKPERKYSCSQWD